MDIKKLDELLQESVNNFSYECTMRNAREDMAEELNGYDYDELARQTFYVMDDFRQYIIKYLESQK